MKSCYFEETSTEVGRQFLLRMEQERFKTYLVLSHGCSDQVALKRDFIRSELHIPENWIFCNAQNRIYSLLKTRTWSINNVCEMFNIEQVQPEHRAKSDVGTAWKIYDHIIRTLHPFENSVNFTNQLLYGETTNNTTT